MLIRRRVETPETLSLPVLGARPRRSARAVAFLFMCAALGGAVGYVIGAAL